MSRFFNTTGPCDPKRHYTLPPEARLVRAQLGRYIKDQLYWVLHAPRQSGKTTFLHSWMERINREGEALACYVSVERCQHFSRADDAIPAACSAIREYAELFLEPELVPEVARTNAASMLSQTLINWASLVAPKPLVVLFDEVDVLEDQGLVSFLRQLRGGFAARGVGKFPVSIALVGMRDLRDYLIRSKDGKPVNPGSPGRQGEQHAERATSPFNIKEDSATLSNFSKEDIHTLAGMHSDETGQPFSEMALDLVWDYTRGQPWLTNALLQKCVWTLCPSGEPVEEQQVRQAREMLIAERAVHSGCMGEQRCPPEAGIATSLDSLAERLKEPRIRRIVEIIMTGEMDPTLTEGDDFRLAMDLGLVIKVGG